MFSITLSLIILNLISLLFIRLCFTLPSINKNKSKLKTKTKLMIVLGSGGHTGEMFRIIKNADLTQYKQIYWIASDSSSLVHLQKFIQQNGLTNTNIVELPRARHIGEGFVSSIFSIAKSLVSTSLKLYQVKPDVVLSNGPGLAVIVCYFYTLLNLIGITKTRFLYVESLARLKRPSLTGKFLVYVVDRFVVQWSNLERVVVNSEYHGVVV